MKPDKVKFCYVDATYALEMIKDGARIELSMWHYPPPGITPDDEKDFLNKYGKKTVEISSEDFSKIWKHFEEFNFKKYADVKKLKFNPPPFDGNDGSVLTLIVDGQKIVDWDKGGELDPKLAGPLKKLIQIPAQIYNEKYKKTVLK